MKPRGGILVEFVLAVNFSAVLLAGAVMFLRWGREQQMLGSAARMGTLLQSRSGVTEQLVRAEVNRYLEEEGVRGVSIVTGRYLDSSSARFYDLVRTRLEKGMLSADVICEREEE